MIIATSLTVANTAAFAASESVNSEDQLIEFEYKVQLRPVTQDQLPLQLMVPIPPSNEQQLILARTITSDNEAILNRSRIDVEPKFNNEFWAVTIDRPLPRGMQVNFVYKVLRHPHHSLDWQSRQNTDYRDGELHDLAPYLRSDRLVPVSGELITKLRKEIPPTAKKPIEKAKAIFDYVVDHMEYKKVGSGWGNGDTYWACSQKYGNCTDFHALLTSMTRAEGIPTQFGIGFPIPLDRTSGLISGYHCWVELYLPTLGWTPVDASEAKKHPERRAMLFGNQPADRILFSRGRDLKLPGMQSQPLNYFIYPLLEHGSQVVLNQVTSSFNYRLLPMAKSA